MKKVMFLFLHVLLALPLLITSAVAFDGIPGATDKVPAASLIVPFFEVGIDSAHNEDTIIMVTNTDSDINKFHWHVWDIDGKATDLEGNVDIVGKGMWVRPMKTLMEEASTATKSDLTVGNYYQGFVTIDVVTDDQHNDPTKAGYPFGNDNDLEGYIYYVSLADGMANGIGMIPLEYVGAGVNAALTNFYGNGDGREQIDSEARDCASKLIDGGACAAEDDIDQIDSRVYLQSADAQSRIVIFTWSPGLTVGPSTWCAANGCEDDLPYKQYNQSGTLISSPTETIQLTHMVNVIDVTGTENGWVSIEDVPSGIANYQAFAFALNTLKSSDASLNWVAILESYIEP